MTPKFTVEKAGADRHQYYRVTLADTKIPLAGSREAFSNLVDSYWEMLGVATADILRAIDVLEAREAVLKVHPDAWVYRLTCEDFRICRTPDPGSEIGFSSWSEDEAWLDAAAKLGKPEATPGEFWTGANIFSTSIASAGKTLATVSAGKTLATVSAEGVIEITGTEEEIEKARDTFGPENKALYSLLLEVARLRAGREDHVNALDIANRSADDQMHKKRAAQEQVEEAERHLGYLATFMKLPGTTWAFVVSETISRIEKLLRMVEEGGPRREIERLTNMLKDAEDRWEVATKANRSFSNQVDDLKKQLEVCTRMHGRRQQEVENWMDTAAQHLRNTDYYRGLVERIGLLFGKEAFTCDDGSTQHDVLNAKVPELVEAAMKELWGFRNDSQKYPAAEGLQGTVETFGYEWQEIRTGKIPGDEDELYITRFPRQYGSTDFLILVRKERYHDTTGGGTRTVPVKRGELETFVVDVPPVTP